MLAPLLTFVLPVARSDTGRDEFDLQRVQLLCATLDRYFDKAGLASLFVIAPATDLAAARIAVQPYLGCLKIELLDENDICPEFVIFPDTQNRWPRPNLGWYRQQLIKLAMHQHVKTSFYMTLDADVLFVRPFSAATLIRSGKAALGTLTAEDFKGLFRSDVALHEINVRLARVGQAERALGLERPARYLGHWYAETPALLSRDIAGDLARCIEARWKAPWRAALLQHLPWTEYSLYYLFAEATGVLERFHAPGGVDSVLRFSQSLWQPSSKYLEPMDLTGWNANAVFDADREGVAVVIQSYLNYPVGDVRKAIAHILPIPAEFDPAAVMHHMRS